MKYGIQMYSVRDLASQSLEEAIKRVALMGYSYVEYAGFFGHPAEQVREWQEKYGVEVSGTHSDWRDLFPEKIYNTIAFHKIIGNKNFIIPGTDLGSLEKIKVFADTMNYAQPILEENGIRLGYHNHSHEFAVRSWGSTIHSELELRTNIDFEIDTFWAFNAGVDPVECMKRLKNRVRVIHLKDGFTGGKGIPLGEGEVPVRAVREKAIELGMTMVVESETLTPDGCNEAQRCINFLKKLDAEDGR